MTKPINRLIREDCEVHPLPSLRTIMVRTFKRGARRHRLPDAADMLVSRPHDPEATELYLWELFAFTSRQIDASLALGPTFARTVSELGEDVRNALPAHSLAALEALVRIAPLPLTDPRTLAHSLVIEDGKLVEWLIGQEQKQTKTKTESGQQIFRRLAAKYHPDRADGNAEVMSDLNQLWGSVKQLGGTQ